MAQLMPLPLTVSCFSKIQTGFTFLVPAHLGSPGQRAVKWCVYVNKVKWKTYYSFLQNEIWCHSLFPSCFICDFLWKLFLVCVALPVTVLNCAYALTSCFVTACIDIGTTYANACPMKLPTFHPCFDVVPLALESVSRIPKYRSFENPFCEMRY